MRKYILIASILFGVLLVFNLNWDIIISLDFSVVWKYRVPLLKGLGTSILITAEAALVGFVLGTLLAMVSQSPLAIVRWMIVIYVEIFRNTPLLVQIIWIHFALPLLTGINTTTVQSGILAITVQVIAYFTEIVRAGIEAISRGQWEAAYALGLPKWTCWYRVILPQANRIIVPPLVNLLISLFKATAILTVISVDELMTVTNRISNYTYKPIELYTTAAVIYFLIGYAMSRIASRVELQYQKAER